MRVVRDVFFLILKKIVEVHIETIVIKPMLSRIATAVLLLATIGVDVDGFGGDVRVCGNYCG